MLPSQREKTCTIYKRCYRGRMAGSYFIANIFLIIVGMKAGAVVAMAS